MSETKKKSVRFTIDTSLNNAFVKLGEINKNLLLHWFEEGNKNAASSKQREST